MTDPSFFFSFSFFPFFSSSLSSLSLSIVNLIFFSYYYFFLQSRISSMTLTLFFPLPIITLSVSIVKSFFFSFSSWEAKVVMSLDSNLVFFLLVLSPSLYLSIFFFNLVVFLLFPRVFFFFLVSKLRALFIFHWKWSADHLYVFFVFILPNLCLLKSFVFFISILFLFCHT